MERIRELLEKLGTLTSEELDELHGLIVAEADSLDEQDTSPELVATLNELADAGEKVNTEKTTRAETAAKAEADAAAARDRLKAVRGEDEPEAETPAEEVETPTDETVTDEAEAETPEPVVATGRVRRLANRTGIAKPSPESEEPTNQSVVIASGALRGVDTSKPIESQAELAQAMSETLKRMDRRSAARGDVLLASATWSYPPERTLTDDQAHNAEVMDAIINPEAIVASGGVCAPVNVDYDVPTFSTAERPLKEGLPAFAVSRGGLRFITPPDFAELEGATGVWTEATDTAPGIETKPLIHVVCGGENIVYVDAVPTRLGFGNMQGQFSPEYVAANTELAVVAAARIAENQLLKRIEEACVKNLKAPKALSATRDFITQLEQTVSVYRWLHRISPNTMLTGVFPQWLINLIKIDLAKEAAHDNSGPRDVLAVTDAQVEDLIKAHGVNPIFHLDGQAEPASKNFPLQGFAAFTEGAEFKEVFPAKTAWYLFVEGSIQFLDGGRLDLGVVRDSTLDATNDYETFIETFESIAFRGFKAGAVQVVSEFQALGNSEIATTSVIKA